MWGSQTVHNYAALQLTLRLKILITYLQHSKPPSSYFSAIPNRNIFRHKGRKSVIWSKKGRITLRTPVAWNLVPHHCATANCSLLTAQSKLKGILKWKQWFEQFQVLYFRLFKNPTKNIVIFHLNRYTFPYYPTRNNNILLKLSGWSPPQREPKQESFCHQSYLFGKALKIATHTVKR